MTPVYLRLERCNGTVTWCRPPWGDPRRGGTGAAAILGHDDASCAGAGAALDAIEDAVSPGLRLKYTNRSGESLVRRGPLKCDLKFAKKKTLKIRNYYISHA